MRNNNTNDKYIIINEYVAGKITRKKASIILGCSLKTISRLKKNYLIDGRNSFIHKNTGKTPVNKTNKQLENKIIKLYKKYNEYNFTHFLDENLKDIKLSDKTITRILNKNGFISPKSHKKKKKGNIHPLRQRKEYFGELIQMDGSQKDWTNTNQIWHLHLAIDDATNTIIAGFFGLEETTVNYIKCLYQILINYGIPKCFYTDNRTSFNIKRSGKNIDAQIQFKRILNDFGIDIKTTSIPQAKGRVERYNGVLKDRLSNELKFNKINNINDANKYLIDVYIPKHNNRFALSINSNKIIFNKCELNTDELNLALGLKYKRKVLQGNVISINNIFYKAYDNNKHEVMFWNSEKVIIIFTYNGQILLKRPLNNMLYSLRFFKNNKVNSKSHPTVINHIWKNPNNYGKSLKEQVW
jgi:transposase